MRRRIRWSRLGFAVPLLVGAAASAVLFLAVRWVSRTHCLGPNPRDFCADLSLNAMMGMTTIWAVAIVLAARRWWLDACTEDPWADTSRATRWPDTGRTRF